MHDTILNALREEAKELAIEKFTHPKEELRTLMQNIFVEGYVAGGASVLKKEISDRIHEKFSEDKSKKKHTKKLKTAYKKAPKV